MTGEPQVQYRLGVAGDSDAVAALHAASWRRHYRGAYADAYLDGDIIAERREVWARRMATPREDQCTIVAKADGALVGFVHWRLVRKEGPDQDGYERLACPGQGEHPHLSCPLRPEASVTSLGKIPVLVPPSDPPKVCTQSAVTIAPDIGARHRQDLAFGSPEWVEVYATYRNTIEGTNGFVKDPAHESLQAPARRRVRGIAAQSLFVGLLVMSANIRKIHSFREMRANGEGPAVAERARRRRTSLCDFHPLPPPA
jgi:hypothetical protein